MIEVKKRKKYFKPYTEINGKSVTIMWDYKPIFKTNINGDEIETPFGIWQEHTFNYIPELSDIKKVVLDYYNKQIDERILNGLVWNGMKIWLSSENQFNYKAAYDLAFQTNGTNLPIYFKFGDETEPVYHEFKTLDEISDFYINSINYIQSVLQQGWTEKESIDWNIFQK